MRLSKLLPPVLAALIVAAGFLVPQEMLSRREERLKSDAGAVDTRDISALACGASGSKRKILRSAELAVELFGGDDGLEPEGIERREPLDTELCYDEAVGAAAMFLEIFLRNTESYGMPLDGSFYEPPPCENGGCVSSAAVGVAGASDISDDVFCSAADDASVSFWLVRRNGLLMVLDGVSGTPLYISLSLCLDVNDSEALRDVISRSVEEAYNELYSFSFSAPSDGGYSLSSAVSSAEGFYRVRIYISGTTSR